MPRIGVTNPTEVFAKFRLSIDNGFRGEFSYVHYRRWGVVELWEGGRFRQGAPTRITSATCIEIWLNWELMGTYRSYEEVRAKVVALLREAPVSLHDLAEYLAL